MMSRALLRATVLAGIAGAVLAAVAVVSPTIVFSAAPSCRWHVVDGLGYDAIAGISPDDVWLVGSRETRYKGSTGTFNRVSTMRWDGRRLRAVKNPVGVGNLSDIAVIGPREAWAVGAARGGPLIQHWNGRVWQVVPPPPVTRGLSAVAVVGGRVWVLAANGRIYERVQRRWRPLPNSPRADELHAAPPADAWTAWQPNPYLAGGVAHRWNGRQWTRIAGTRPFVQVRPRTADDVWATQTRKSGSFALVHWEPPSRWRDVPTRAEPIGVDALNLTDVYVLSRRGEIALLERLYRGRLTQSVIPFEVLPYYVFEVVAPQDVWVSASEITAHYAC